MTFIIWPTLPLLCSEKYPFLVHLQLPHHMTRLLCPAPQVTPDSQYEFGSYNCTATNAMGTESKEFLLIQAGL